MKCFSVPADFKMETIDQYEILNNAYADSKIVETYGNITTGCYFGSGRSFNQLPNVNLHDLQIYIEYSERKGIGFNYTFNPSFMQNREFSEEGILEIKQFLRTLYEVGVRSLIIAMPSLIEIAKSVKCNFDIKLSTIAPVINANQARAYKRMGVQRIVIHESIQRDFYTLKRIRNAFGDKIEIILNSICHKNCIYRPFHYNQISSDSIRITSKLSRTYFGHRCLLQRYENIGEVLKLSWIRPEDIKYYTGIGINNFKLQGRQLVLKGDPVRTAAYYFKEYYDGDLMALLDMFKPFVDRKLYIDNKKLKGFLRPFIEKENFCKNDCVHCGYCESVAEKCVKSPDSESKQDFINWAKKYYTEYDDFRKILARIIDNKNDRNKIK